jgi:2,4-dienoyl-CoA reductase-like NADH-dependent reductase (Old Yellow Enzyme family)
VNEELINHYKDLASGGVGFIITGYAYVNSLEQPNPYMMGIDHDDKIEGLRQLVDNVHNHDTKIALQIVYGGSQTHHPKREEFTIFGPSAIKNIVTGVTPIEATLEDIKGIVSDFSEAARRAKEAGFDSVQIHAAHGYLLSQFLTPYYNRRTDEYGGGIHNRARIIYEVIDGVRKVVGNDYPIMIKLNHNDFMDNGLTENDAFEVFQKISEMGVELLEVSGVNESSGLGLLPARTRLSNLNNQSYFKEFTSKLSKMVNSKVILMGGNRNPMLLNDILNESNIEYFSLARPLLGETDLINKWKEDISYKPRCLSCNKCWDTYPNSCILDRMEIKNV